MRLLQNKIDDGVLYVTRMALLGIVLLPATLYAYTPPIGIPDPGDTWGGGLHPIDTPVPQQPAGWPGTEVEHYYYIDNSNPNCTDSNNRYGYPDKPRCAFTARVLPAGTYVEFHGNPTNTMQTTWECTADAPCWIVGRVDDRPVFTGEKNETYPGDGRIILTNSSYVFVDGLEFTHKHAGAVQVDNAGSGKSHHISIRNCYAHDYDFQSNGSAFGIGARDQGETYDCVMYNNTCERLGDADAQVDTDIHCTVYSIRNGNQDVAEAHNLYWLHNTANHSGGSGIQVNGWDNGQSHLHHIYIGRNMGDHNRQRLIGIKESSDVIISQNDYIPGYEVSNAGYVNEIFGWQESPDRVWFLFNNVKNASNGWRCGQPDSGGHPAPRYHDLTHIYIIGNKVSHIHLNDKQLAKYGQADPNDNWRYGAGIFEKNGSATVYVIDNTFYDTDTAILMNRPETWMYAYGNIFKNIDDQQVYIGLEEVGDGNKAGCKFDGRYNIYHDDQGTKRWRIGTTNYTSYADWQEALATWQPEQNFDVGSIMSDPLFVNGQTGDFRLTEGSPAKDANNSPRDVYDLFQSLYGIDIRVDFNGVPRPQGAGWDMGAFEYNEGQQGNGDFSGGMFPGGSGSDGHSGNDNGSGDGASGPETLQSPTGFHMFPFGQ